MIEIFIVVVISLAIGFMIAVWIDKRIQIRKQKVDNTDIKRFIKIIKSCKDRRKLEAHIDIIDTYLRSHDIDFYSDNLQELYYLKVKIREQRNELL